MNIGALFAPIIAASTIKPGESGYPYIAPKKKDFHDKKFFDRIRLRWLLKTIRRRALKRALTKAEETIYDNWLWKAYFEILEK